MAEQKNSSDKKHYSFCLFNNITTESIKPLIELLKNIEQYSVLDLYINSRGGFVQIAIGIYNFIKSIKGLEINTYNVGYCDSAATLLFMSGNKRYALKNSSFFMHSLQINFTQPQTINSLSVEIIKLKEDTNTFIDLLVKNSNISKKQWSIFMNDSGCLIKAKRALEIGIIHYVVDELNIL